MIRVFIVDDHTLIRDGLRTLLAADPLFEVVGEAGNGQELLDQLPDVAADVVLLDLNMPVLDGLATTHRLRAEYPHLRILLLSMMTHE
ncbi:MAG: response regulator transcription factor, partial [Bacteroidota bacterium]|nr:response regulator transcription factor [Bacteroidota bacterium]